MDPATHRTVLIRGARFDAEPRSGLMSLLDPTAIARPLAARGDPEGAIPGRLAYSRNL